MAYETSEKYYRGESKHDTLTIEPSESNPVVDTLNDKTVLSGTKCTLDVDYLAKSNINIQWARNGVVHARGKGFSSSGSTSMVINYVQPIHSKTYSVTITDEQGRTASTQCKITVQ